MLRTCLPIYFFTDAAGLIQEDGSKRQNVQEDRANMGYLLGKTGTNVDIHETGHMLGFMDRYTDYKKSDGGAWCSIFHSGYKGDLMGTNELNLNHSHYNDAVQYTNYKLTIGQKNLLPSLRTNSVSVNGNFDGFTPSATSPDDIPTGWIKK